MTPTVGQIWVRGRERRLITRVEHYIHASCTGGSGDRILCAPHQWEKWAGLAVLAENQMWTKVNENRFVRSDGAVVMWDQRSPNPNPGNPRSRLWTAWEPDPSESALFTSRRGSRLRWPRRWKTAEVAMATVDALYPLKTCTRFDKPEGGRNA